MFVVVVVVVDVVDGRLVLLVVIGWIEKASTTTLFVVVVVVVVVMTATATAAPVAGRNFTAFFIANKSLTLYLGGLINQLVVVGWTGVVAVNVGDVFVVVFGCNM